MPGSLMLGNIFDLVEGFPTVDLQSGNNCGDWISLRNSARVGIFFTSGVGSACDDPTLTIQQAKNACGGSVKSLAICTGKAFKKQAATNLSAVTTWTSASGCVGTGCCTHTLTNLTSAEQSAMWYVEFDSSELDVACQFNFIRATVADIGCNAQPGSLTYIVAPKYPSAPVDTLTVLT